MHSPVRIHYMHIIPSVSFNLKGLTLPPPSPHPPSLHAFKRAGLGSGGRWQGRIQGGWAAGAGSPSPIGTGAPAPKAQGCPFSSHFDEYLSPGSIFAPKVIYGRLSTSGGALLIKKTTLSPANARF